MIEFALIVVTIAFAFACAVIKWQRDLINQKDSDNG